MRAQTLAVPGATPRPLLYQGVVPGIEPHSNCHISQLTFRIEVFLTILEFTCYELLIAYGFIFIPLSLHGWEAFPTPGALTHTKITVGPSHQWRHKSWVSLHGPPCVYGVLGTPHGEVRDKLYLLCSLYRSNYHSYSLDIDSNQAYSLNIDFMYMIECNGGVFSPSLVQRSLYNYLFPLSKILYFWLLI